MGAGVATGPHFPAVVRLARRLGFLPWADRDRPKPCGLILSLSGFPTFRIAASGGPPIRFLQRPCGLIRFQSGLDPACALLPPFSGLRSGTSLLLTGGPGSDRQTGQQFRLGPGSRFLRRKAPVPPDGFRKVGSASALEQLPRASSFGRPAISSAASILANFRLVGPGYGFRASVRFRSAAPGHELKVSCFPSRAKRNPPVDKLYIGDKFGPHNQTDCYQRLERKLPRLEVARCIVSPDSSTAPGPVAEERPSRNNRLWSFAEKPIALHL